MQKSKKTVTAQKTFSYALPKEDAAGATEKSGERLFQ